jgi:hypothetical protein
MGRGMEWGKSHATPGWAKNAGPDGGSDFLKERKRQTRRAVAAWLTAKGIPCDFASDEYLAKRAAEFLGHNNPQGTPIEYLMRCFQAKLFPKVGAK